MDISFSSDGRRALSAAWDGSLIIWDMQTMKREHYFEAAQHQFIAARLSPNGKIVLSAAKNVNYISLWDVSTGNRVGKLLGHTRGLTGLLYSADGRKAISGSYDRTVVLWDLQSGKPMSRIFTDEPVFCLDWRENTVAVGGQSGDICFLKINGL